MKKIPNQTVLLAALCAAFAVTPVFAQDAVQGMDMAQMQPPARKLAKPATQKKPHPKKAQPKTSATHSMRGMDMSSMPGMTMPSQSTPDKQHAEHAGAMPGMNMAGMSMQPPPNLTGAMQKLDIGSQIGTRPVVRGLNLETMQMDMQGMQMQGGKAPADARSAD